MTSDYFHGEEEVVRTITSIVPDVKCFSGFKAMADGGVPCEHCGRTPGTKIVGLTGSGVDAGWFMPLDEEDETDSVSELFARVVEQVVLDRIKRSELFTAYDITQSLRAIGMQVRHDDVKGIVHTLFYEEKMPGYSWSFLPVADGKPETYVYHVWGQDAYQYNDYTRSLMQPSQYIDLKEDDTEGYVTDTDDEVSEVKDVDELSRIRIPAAILRTAGFESGDLVNVVFDASSNSFDVMPHDVNVEPEDGIIVKQYRVDMYGNLRICLKKTGINATRFKIVADGDMVIARAR